MASPAGQPLSRRRWKNDGGEPPRASEFRACVALRTVPTVEALISAPVIAFLATFEPVTAPFFSFELITAPFFSCLLPTLFFGSETAAYAPPPSAAASASVATTLA